MSTSLVPHRNLNIPTFTVRGQRVILDVDLADIYGVPTKQLNQQRRRNTDRFPEDFVFQLNQKEWKQMRSQIVTASSKGQTMRSQIVTASRRNIRYFLTFLPNMAQSWLP